VPAIGIETLTTSPNLSNAFFSSSFVIEKGTFPINISADSSFFSSSSSSSDPDYSSSSSSSLSSTAAYFFAAVFLVALTSD